MINTSSVFLMMLLGFYSSRHDLSLKPRISEESETYSAEILKQKLNEAGMSRMHFGFVAPTALFKTSPERQNGTRSGITEFLALAEDSLWEALNPWNSRYVGVQIYAGTDQTKITSPDVVNFSQSSSDLQFLWFDDLNLRWHSHFEFGSRVPANGTIRHSAAILPPHTHALCPVIEGVFPFEISGESSWRLELGMGKQKWILLERNAKPFHETVTLTLKLCHTKNWYSGKLQYANRIIETGWREADATCLSGSGCIESADAVSNEWHLFRWQKRAMPCLEEGGKSTKVFMEP